VFLQEQAGAKALAGNDKIAKMLRHIEKAEATKACCRLVCKCPKPLSTRGGNTRIEVAGNEGTARILTEPKEIFDLFLKRNHAHFSQATGTPFTRKPPSANGLEDAARHQLAKTFSMDDTNLMSDLPVHFRRPRSFWMGHNHLILPQTKTGTHHCC
jgi:hypothetical protein